MLSVWLYLLSPQGDAGTQTIYIIAVVTGFKDSPVHVYLFCIIISRYFWLYKQPQMLAMEAKEKVKRGKRTHMAVTGFR